MIDAKWSGGKELKAALDRLDPKIDKAVERAIAIASLEVEAAIKAQFRQSHPAGTETPSSPGSPPAVVTGTLRRSITTRPPVRLGFGSYRAEVGPTVVYSRVQELGGSTGRGGATTLPARPFMKPAYDEWASRDRLRELVAREVNGAIR